MPWVFLGTRVIGPFLTKRPIPNEAAIILSKSVAKKALGPFIYYIITFLGFLDPPPPLRQHVFSTKNKQKLAFSDPPSPPTSNI